MGIKSEHNFDYESPSWAYKQAHDNGRYELVQELLTILNFEPDQERK